ncbi:MAG: extracellular solute-binding protein [Lentisphaerae bacterium]|nr:extracellular solute-binding protein [Lentisphaerota bacterium]
MIARAWSFLRRNFALLFVAAVFAWSVFAIVSYRKVGMPPGAKIQLRIGHWQLEAGVREAFDRLAEEYRRLHPEVSIVQDAIPESSYGTWMTTQLMGGTAPDMIEVGSGLPYNVLLGYHSRYFVPLTPYVNEPNPYNRGTPLEGVPWQKTYKDGMRGSYVGELTQYMTVPLAQFGIRVFYNRNLLRKLTGLDEAPHDYRAFIRVCETIRGRSDEQGRPYTPITSSGYHAGMWDGFMCAPLTYGAVRRVDFNRDGAVGSDELFVGFKTGQIGFDFPPYEARFRMLRELTDQFQTGFTGLGRDEAVFLFAQQRAVFITTGTWDAGSLVEQARGVFEVGIMDFPAPARDDPEFGAIVQGPVYENPSAAFAFAITRTSRYPEVALDFLRFLGSRGWNQELNRIIGWIPAIQGASVSPLVKAFEPHLEGVFGAFPVDGLGGETGIKWGQQFSLFQVHQTDYKQMVAEFLPFYLTRGVEELAELHRNRRRGVRGDEQFVAGVRARAMAGSGEEAVARWSGYRGMTAGRLFSRNLGAAQLQTRLDAGVVTNAVGPYEFSPEVVARVRARLAGGDREVR